MRLAHLVIGLRFNQCDTWRGIIPPHARANEIQEDHSRMSRQQRKTRPKDVLITPGKPVLAGRALQSLFDNAMSHHGAGRLDDAERLYSQILAVNPQHADAMHLLGVIACQTGRPELAAKKIADAIGLNGSTAFYYSNLSNALRQLGRPDEAAEACRQAIKLSPDFAQAHANLGSALYDAGHFEEAVSAYTMAVRLNPADALSHSNLGSALLELGHGEAARSSCQTAINLKPDEADFHLNLSFVLLKTGALREGWEKFEWRWRTPQMARFYRNFVEPLWHGEAAAGKTLLVHAEQGFGDTLQFCRYAPLAAALGLRIILEVQKPLVRLLGSLPGVDRVIGQGDELPPFHFHAPVMSLPRAFGTEVSTIPGKTPYLHADEDAAASWGQRVAALAGQRPRIGLLWTGNPRAHSPILAAISRRRAMAPELFAPLCAIQDLAFFSLQKEGAAPPPEFPLIDLMDEVKDFADTAALIANLDLVISVDTAVAHVAAAIGKKVWLLNRFDSCWRWFMGRRDSPWYPEIRLYNQPQSGDWKSVIAEIAADLIVFQKNYF